MNNTFMFGITFINILLWGSYSYFLKDQTNMIRSELWNNIQIKERMPLLIMASIAYLLNIFLALYFYIYKYLQSTSITVIFASYMIYYILQLFFIPLLIKYTNIHSVGLTKKANYYKLLIRLLLIIVVIPMGIIMVYGLQESKKIYTSNKLLSAIVALSAIVPFLHVLINDAYLFGFYF